MTPTINFHNYMMYKIINYNFMINGLPILSKRAIWLTAIVTGKSNTQAL
jgi:hypothetical protein